MELSGWDREESPSHGPHIQPRNSRRNEGVNQTIIQYAVEDIIYYHQVDQIRPPNRYLKHFDSKNPCPRICGAKGSLI